MVVTTQENDRDHVERKSNKRKKRDALGEDGSVQMDDERHRKKKKEILVDQNASDSKIEKKKKRNKTGDEGEVSKEENVSEEIESMKNKNKKKKKKEILVDKNASDSKIEKKKKRNRTGDEGEGSKEDNMSKEIGPMENKSKKKKKKEDELNGNNKKKKRSGDTREASPVYDEAGPVESSKREKNKKRENEANDTKREKTKKKKKKSRDGGASREEDVSKEVEPMKDRKKKKATDESKAASGGEDVDTSLVENQNVKTKSAKSKKKKKKYKDDLGVGSLDEELVTGSNEKSGKDRSSKKKKMKKKMTGSDIEGEGKGALKTSKKKNHIETSTPSKKSKVVRFSDQVEFLSLTDNSGGTEKLKDHRKGREKFGRLKQGNVSTEENDEPEQDNKGLIQGQRFTKEEDEVVKNAVFNYIEKYKLGEKGLEMVLKCRQYPEVLKHPWREISEALPTRPYQSIYNRAHILFERSESRRWTPKDIEQLKELHKKYGPDWRKIGDEMGKHRIHVKDTWRRIRYIDMKKGQWSQDEYGTLFELVNMDLRLKVFQEKKSQHGMLRDNISWEAIGDKLSTRGNSLCCMKWYDKLTSSMVAEGIWADADDYRLIIALEELDAACLDDVDWDGLLEHRAGDVCRKRWNQMVQCIGEHGVKSFGEQVEILSKRYCPDLLEDRLAWDSKIPVDL